VYDVYFMLHKVVNVTHAYKEVDISRLLFVGLRF